MNRYDYFTAIADRLHADELTYVQRMYWLVKEAHRTQVRRLTGQRFFEHLRNVSYMAAVEFGFCDVMTLALGLGHDVIEDTYVPPGVIVNLFGQQLYSEMLSLSKEIPSFHPVTGSLTGRVKVGPGPYFEKLKMGSARPIRVKSIAKWVRKGHVQTTHNWKMRQVVKNGLKGSND